MKGPGGDERDIADRSGPSRRGLASRRVVWTSFGISAALHLIAILLYPAYSDHSDPAGVLSRLPTFSGPVSGTEIVRLIDIGQILDAEEPEEPEVVEEVEVRPPSVAAPILDGLPSVEFTPPPPSDADRLRERLGDARLWQPLDAVLNQLTLEQREMLLLSGRIENMNDSLAAAAAAALDLTDWTYTDGEGKRWGVSPGKLHLGDITLPLPFSFGTPVGKRAEVAQRAWQWEEITRQGARAEVQEAWKDRAQAIRERRDRERAARPDTVRGGR